MLYGLGIFRVSLSTKKKPPEHVLGGFFVYAFSICTRPEKKVAPPPISDNLSGVSAFTSCFFPCSSAHNPWLTTTPGSTCSPTAAVSSHSPRLFQIRTGAPSTIPSSSASFVLIKSFGVFSSLMCFSLLENVEFKKLWFGPEHT